MDENTSIFVSNLIKGPEALVKHEVRHIFTKYGQIIKIEVLNQGMSGEAQIRFFTPQQKKEALSGEHLKSHDTVETILQVKPWTKQLWADFNSTTKTIYLSRIPNGVKNSDIKKKCDPFGEILMINSLPRIEKNSKALKCLGLNGSRSVQITFKTADSAKASVMNLCLKWEQSWKTVLIAKPKGETVELLSLVTEDNFDALFLSNVNLACEKKLQARPEFEIIIKELMESNIYIKSDLLHKDEQNKENENDMAILRILYKAGSDKNGLKGLQEIANVIHNYRNNVLMEKNPQIALYDDVIGMSQYSAPVTGSKTSPKTVAPSKISKFNKPNFVPVPKVPKHILSSSSDKNSVTNQKYNSHENDPMTKHELVSARTDPEILKSIIKKTYLLNSDPKLLAFKKITVPSFFSRIYYRSHDKSQISFRHINISMLQIHTKFSLVESTEKTKLRQSSNTRQDTAHKTSKLPQTSSKYSDYQASTQTALKTTNICSTFQKLVTPSIPDSYHIALPAELPAKAIKTILFYIHGFSLTEIKTKDIFEYYLVSEYFGVNNLSDKIINLITDTYARDELKFFADEIKEKLPRPRFYDKTKTLPDFNNMLPVSKVKGVGVNFVELAKLEINDRLF